MPLGSLNIASRAMLVAVLVCVLGGFALVTRFSVLSRL